MPKCKINGKEIEVPAGTSIIQAFKMMEQDICHYCWHEGLSVAGVCRLCMVEIEGMPKLQIACNTEIKEGMVINNTSEKVKDTVQWGLDFHLINHPLDCPICDQAGECGLQDQYMKFGRYDSEMAQDKVKKRKVVDLGPTVVLDSERCILCSRCVRFTDEVSKTNELGIFNRGDRSEIGTFEGKPLDNNYSLNTVDICPVGALTSKDFRFRQRAWYLKDGDSVCSGCSTGCNVKMYYNEEGLWRVKPRYNKEVNGHWMCDKGRDTYKHVNAKFRMTQAEMLQSGTWQKHTSQDVAKHAKEALESTLKQHGASSMALIVTGQWTQEELDHALNFWINKVGSKEIFHWQNHPEKWNEFDGILYRGDKNPNTKGLQQLMSAKGLNKTDKDFSAGKYKLVMVLGPEDQKQYDDVADKVKDLQPVDHVVWWTAGPLPNKETLMKNAYVIPSKTAVEKGGTFINFNGLAQKFNRVTTVVPAALDGLEILSLLSGENIDIEHRPGLLRGGKQNHFTETRGSL